MVHVCLSVETALAELPRACAGELDEPPSSGIGSNAAAEQQQQQQQQQQKRRAPRALTFGGAYSDEEVRSMTEAVRARVPGIQAVRVTREDAAAAGVGGPDPSYIAKVLKKKLGELGLEPEKEEEGTSKGE